MSKIKLREILSDIVTNVKDKTGRESFSWGEYSFLIQNYCSPIDQDIKNYVQGIQQDYYILPKDITNCTIEGLQLINAKNGIVFPRTLTNINNISQKQFSNNLFFLCNSTPPVLLENFIFDKNIYVAADVLNNWKNSTNWQGKNILRYKEEVPTLKIINLIHDATIQIKKGLNLNSFKWGEYKNNIKTLCNMNDKQVNTKDNQWIKSFLNRTITNQELAEILNISTINKISKRAFSNCENLSGKVIIPENIAELEQEIFLGSDNITEVVLPDNLTVYAQNFGQEKYMGGLGNQNIIKVSMPNNNGKKYQIYNNGIYLLDQSKLVDTFKGFSFSSFIPKNLEFSFAGKDFIENLDIPNGVVNIHGMAKNCKNLKIVSLPNSVTDFGNFSFNNCSNLETINIPNNNSLSTIGLSTFSNCPKLKQLIFPKNIINFPSGGVLDVYTPPFQGDISLTHISFLMTKPKSNSSFCDLTGATALKTIYIPNITVVPTLSNVNYLADLPNDFVIKVPAALLDEWKAATNWSVYADHIIAAS